MKGMCVDGIHGGAMSGQAPQTRGPLQLDLPFNAVTLSVASRDISEALRAVD